MRWLGLTLAAACLVVALPAAAAPRSYYVSPAGNDFSAGTSINTPLRTIQKALDRALPGETITLAPGVYRQDFQSRRSGTSAAPITLKGPADAVVKGAGAARIGLIAHDYLTLDGFTVDGLWGSAATAAGYRATLLDVGAAAPGRVTGLKLVRLTLLNAGGDCVRFGYGVQRSEIAAAQIGPCGVSGFASAGAGIASAGIAIAAAAERRVAGAPGTPAGSIGNRVHDTVFDDPGGACVTIGATASGTIVEHSRCRGQSDRERAGVEIWGSGTVLRFNEIWDNAGAGVRLGGATTADGVDGEVYGNSIHDNAGGGIAVERPPDGQICGNPMSANAGGDGVGAYGAALRPTAPCAAPPSEPGA